MNDGINSMEAQIMIDGVWNTVLVRYRLGLSRCYLTEVMNGKDEILNNLSDGQLEDLEHIANTSFKDLLVKETGALSANPTLLLS